MQFVDIPEQIRKFAELKEQGIITEEEFQAKKRELLSKDMTPPQDRLTRDVAFRCSKCDTQFKIKEGMPFPKNCPHCGYLRDELTTM